MRLSLYDEELTGVREGKFGRFYIKMSHFVLVFDDEKSKKPIGFFLADNVGTNFEGEKLFNSFAVYLK